jgi:hypothetical protein
VTRAALAGRRLAVVSCWLAQSWTFVECWFGACREFVRGFAPCFCYCVGDSCMGCHRRRLIRFIADYTGPRNTSTAASNAIQPSLNVYTFVSKKKKKKLDGSGNKR